MTYSENAIAFSVLPAGHQVRIEDRVSFVYLEHAAIVQDRTGVVALQNKEEDAGLVRRRILLPVAALAVLALGPGTSITQPAITSCTRSGTTVLFCGGGGVPAYSHATPLTSSARWALAQARVVTDPVAQREAALRLYKRQFGLNAPGGTIATMRGLEGRQVRNLYREMARKWKTGPFKRDVTASDPVNVGLNIGNSILYGCAASACAAIGVSPALGIIHRGAAGSLLYDLADLYKPTVTIPIAFRSAHAEDVPMAVRTAVRSEIVRQRVLVGMLDSLMEVLRDHLPNRDDDTLIDDVGEVEGHKQYSPGPPVNHGDDHEVPFAVEEDTDEPR